MVFLGIALLGVVAFISLLLIKAMLDDYRYYGEYQLRISIGYPCILPAITLLTSIILL